MAVNDSLLKDKTGFFRKIESDKPETIRALEISTLATDVGFEWDNAFQILDKVYEELTELKIEMESVNHTKERLDEMGDVFFVCVNLARKLGINPEEALHHANEKFMRRFSYIANTLSERDIKFEDTSLDQMEELWQEAKRIEKK
ncbi:MAG: hypothetical protein MJ247_02055 [Alphaproteobacteria bacterium]|nr:hypothetical protein [Alphaproteobacteria bacterium]